VEVHIVHVTYLLMGDMITGLERTYWYFHVSKDVEEVFTPARPLWKNIAVKDVFSISVQGDVSQDQAVSDSLLELPAVYWPDCL
jgi:hypothetical protein